MGLRKAAVQQDHERVSLAAENVRLRDQLSRTRKQLSDSQQYVEKLKAALAIRAEDVGSTAAALHQIASETVGKGRITEFLRENEQLKERLGRSKDLIAEATRASALAAKGMQGLQEENARLQRRLSTADSMLLELETVRAEHAELGGVYREAAAERDQLRAELSQAREDLEALRVVQDSLLLEYGAMQDRCDELERGGALPAVAPKVSELAETNRSLLELVSRQKEENQAQASELAAFRDLAQSLACALNAREDDATARAEALRALESCPIPSVAKLLRAISMVSAPRDLPPRGPPSLGGSPPALSQVASSSSTSGSNGLAQDSFNTQLGRELGKAQALRRDLARLNEEI